jgi:hypothetical protein
MPRKASKPQEKPPKPPGRAKKVRRPAGGVHWRRKFLGTLAKDGIVAVACRKSGVSVAAAYEHRKNDAAFALAWDDALEAAVDKAEQELYRRGVLGVKEPVYYQGVVAGHVLRYSDGLLQAYLKAKRRREFGDKTEITGASGSPLVPQQVTGEVTLTYDHDAFARQFEQFTRGLGLAGAAAAGAGGGGVGGAGADGAAQPVDPEGTAR